MPKFLVPSGMMVAGILMITASYRISLSTVPFVRQTWSYFCVELADTPRILPLISVDPRTLHAGDYHVAIQRTQEPGLKLWSVKEPVASQDKWLLVVHRLKHGGAELRDLRPGPDGVSVVGEEVPIATAQEELRAWIQLLVAQCGDAVVESLFEERGATNLTRVRRSKLVQANVTAFVLRVGGGVLIVAGGLIPFVFALFRRSLRRRRELAGRCVSCGYILGRGETHSCCPECGWKCSVEPAVEGE